MSFVSGEELGFLPHLPGEPEAINADSFDEDVLASPVPVLVEFWAARCGPCRRVAPELAKVRLHFAERLRVFTLNVDEELEAATRFSVWTIPALVLFADGREIARRTGFFDAADQVEWLAPLLPSATE